MTKHNPRFGPLTFGVLLGASIGLAVATFGLCTLHAGGNDNDYDSILVVAICAATIGFLLGFAAEPADTPIIDERFAEPANK